MCIYTSHAKVDVKALIDFYSIGANAIGINRLLVSVGLGMAAVGDGILVSDGVRVACDVAVAV